MSLLYNDIKQIVDDKVSAMQPCNIQTGTYQADGSITSDLGVEPYPPESIIIPEIVRKGVIARQECTNPECALPEYVHVKPLEPGDSVIFIVDHGGQKLLVLGRTS